MAPERQQMRALERANAIRLARADLKRRIAHGEVTAAEVILSCPAGADRWPIGDLLMSQRSWGSSRCRKFLSPTQITETRPVGMLTHRQRRILADSLDRGAVVRARELAPV
ncbi:MAG: hypothetical protein ACRDL5_12320 [Solirubrobacteraceae bacterium]